MKAYELIGEVDERHELHLVVPQECATGKVRVLVMEQESAFNNVNKEKGKSGQSLLDLINACQMDTGIEDLAHEHDHYIHGTPKRNDR